jgi:hypothetical protein
MEMPLRCRRLSNGAYAVPNAVADRDKNKKIDTASSL